MKRLSLFVAIAAALTLSACASSRPPTPTLAAAPELGAGALQQPAAPPATLACPACKIIIDYSALQEAGAALEKHAYGAWVAVREGYQSGALAWADLEKLVYEACDKADEVKAYIAASEKAIRELAERRPRAAPGGGG